MSEAHVNIKLSSVYIPEKYMVPDTMKLKSLIQLSSHFREM